MTLAKLKAESKHQFFYIQVMISYFVVKVHSCRVVLVKETREEGSSKYRRNELLLYIGFA